MMKRLGLLFTAFLTLGAATFAVAADAPKEPTVQQEAMALECASVASLAALPSLFGSAELPREVRPGEDMAGVVAKHLIGTAPQGAFAESRRWRRNALMMTAVYRVQYDKWAWAVDPGASI